MSKGPVNRARALDIAVIDFMSEFMRYLIAAGVTNSSFSNMARIAYFNAASVDARFPNQRINQSALAATTGLTRVQVREYVRRGTAASIVKGDRVDKVLEAWSTDPAFATSRYRPRQLRISGKGNTFHCLVRRYGGDVPPRSVLRVLLRNGLVIVDRDMVRIKPRARQSQDAFRLTQMIQLLVSVLKSPPPTSSARSPIRSTSLDVTYSATSAKGRILLQQRFAKSLRAFGEDLRAAGIATSVESPAPITQRHWKTRSRIVLISEDFEC